jgi:hypothetical protein
MAINQDATLRIQDTKKALYNFVIRCIYKYARFIDAEGDTKFRDALIDSLKSLDWVTYQVMVVSNSRFAIVQDLNLADYDLPSFVAPEK